MNLGFDIDGVISNFSKQLVEIIERKYNITLADADMYSYEVDLVLGITKDEVGGIVFETLSSDSPLYPLAKEILSKLSSEGHNIYLITARNEALIPSTSKWLNKNCIPHNDVFYLTRGKKSSATIPLDLVVEDNLEEALELTKKVKHVLLFNQPWNKTKNVKGLVKRIYSWTDIYEEVKLLEDQFKASQ
jgi:uncharacterized HAD superfamily protein